ncbi:MAG: response regulator [Armatimonadia bacterium]
MPKKVLVVEDERNIATLLAKIVESCGVEVEVAHDGLAALTSLRKGKPDLMLLDLIMPIMSGEEVLDEVQSDDDLRDLPIILVTTRSVAQGAAAKYKLLQKPFSPTEVRDAVKQALDL